MSSLVCLSVEDRILRSSKTKNVTGAMTIGKPGVEQTRTHTPEDAIAILDIFQKYGHNEIDTSRFYGEGSSEEYLAKIKWQERGLVMDTKYYPTAGKPLVAPDQPEGGWRHTPEHLRENLMKSLKALNAQSVDMWYLHGPDRTTPYETTLRAVNDLYKEGLFKRFAISNYMAWVSREFGDQML